MFPEKWVGRPFRTREVAGAAFGGSGRLLRSAANPALALRLPTPMSALNKVCAPREGIQTNVPISRPRKARRKEPVFLVVIVFIERTFFGGSAHGDFHFICNRTPVWGRRFMKFH